MQLLATPVDRARLPDDVEVLKDMLVEAAQAFQALRSQASQQMSSLAAQLAEFKRRVFGGRSEVLAVLQPELWQEVVELPVPPEQHDEVKGHRRRRQGRPAIDEHLPRRRVEHDLSDEDKAAFARVVRIGEEVSETLERVLARHGVRRSRQTLCDWTLGAAELLAPLMVPLKRHVLGSAVIFTDDTTLALKAPRGEPRGRTLTARLWVYLAGGWLPDPEQRWRRVAPAALYDFTTDRSGAHARRMLGAWRGFLQADDFAGYSESFRSGVVHAACLVHARRRFAKIVKDAPKGSPPGLAHEAMRYFAEV